MTNRFWLSFTAALTLTCTAFAAPSPDTAAKFKKAVAEVDMNGEMLYYQNTQGVQKLLTKFIPQLLKHSMKDNPFAPIVIQSWDSLCKMINPEAFEAVALSSTEIDEDLYLFKSFFLLDRQKKSILIEPDAVNTPLEWQDFPEDTIAAVKGRINLKHLWEIFRAQAEKSPDQTIQSLILQIEMLKQSGIDIDRIISGVEGDFEFIVAGTSLSEPDIKIVIPDKSGVFSALIVPLLNGSKLPADNLQLKSAMLQDKLVFYTNERLLTPAKAKLGNSAIFKKFAAHLPQKGNLAAAFHISQQHIDQLKYTTAAQNPVFADITSFLKPIALLGVQTAESNGDKAIIVSNFSIPQAQQICSLVAPAAATLLPALDSAREKSRVMQCFNNMKRFGLACSLFADSNNGNMPDSVDKLIEQNLLKANIAANVIYLAHGVKTSEIVNPSLYPMAICDRFNHKSDAVCIVFLDGHAETLNVPADADEKDIIDILCKKYNYPQKVRETLINAVSKE